MVGFDHEVLGDKPRHVQRGRRSSPYGVRESFVRLLDLLFVRDVPTYQKIASHPKIFFFHAGYHRQSCFQAPRSIQRHKPWRHSREKTSAKPLPIPAARR